jgi:NAD(P)H-binding
MHRSSRPDGFLDELAAQHPDRLSGTHKDILRDSGLDWTVVRPPRLTDKP